MSKEIIDSYEKARKQLGSDVAIIYLLGQSLDPALMVNQMHQEDWHLLFRAAMEQGKAEIANLVVNFATMPSASEESVLAFYGHVGDLFTPEQMYRMLVIWVKKSISIGHESAMRWLRIMSLHTKRTKVVGRSSSVLSRVVHQRREGDLRAPADPCKDVSWLEFYERHIDYMLSSMVNVSYARIVSEVMREEEGSGYYLHPRFFAARALAKVLDATRRCWESGDAGMLRIAREPRQQIAFLKELYTACVMRGAEYRPNIDLLEVILEHHACTREDIVWVLRMVLTHGDDYRHVMDIRDRYALMMLGDGDFYAILALYKNPCPTDDSLESIMDRVENALLLADEHREATVCCALFNYLLASAQESAQIVALWRVVRGQEVLEQIPVRKTILQERLAKVVEKAKQVLRGSGKNAALYYLMIEGGNDEDEKKRVKRRIRTSAQYRNDPIALATAMLPEIYEYRGGGGMPSYYPEHWLESTLVRAAFSSTESIDEMLSIIPSHDLGEGRSVYVWPTWMQVLACKRALGFAGSERDLRRVEREFRDLFQRARDDRKSGMRGDKLSDRAEVYQSYLLRRLANMNCTLEVLQIRSIAIECKMTELTEDAQERLTMLVDVLLEEPADSESTWSEEE
jgi:hypothetical protein